MRLAKTELEKQQTQDEILLFLIAAQRHLKKHQFNLNHNCLGESDPHVDRAQFQKLINALDGVILNYDNYNKATAANPVFKNISQNNVQISCETFLETAATIERHNNNTHKTSNGMMIGGAATLIAAVVAVVLIVALAASGVGAAIFMISALIILPAMATLFAGGAIKKGANDTNQLVSAANEISTKIAQFFKLPNKDTSVVKNQPSLKLQ